MDWSSLIVVERERNLETEIVGDELRGFPLKLRLRSIRLTNEDSFFFIRKGFTFRADRTVF